jgi:hypothetical protein
LVFLSEHYSPEETSLYGNTDVSCGFRLVKAENIKDSS